MSTILKDVKSFISSRDLIVFAVGIALSNQLQSTIHTMINALIMPFFSAVTGPTNLASRTIDLKPPSDKLPAIKVGWGAALNALLTFLITLVIMVELVKYVTTRFVKSSSVTWNSV
jgi:large-conductance mechanosensitive channel